MNTLLLFILHGISNLVMAIGSYRLIINTEASKLKISLNCLIIGIGLLIFTIANLIYIDLL